MTLDDLAPDALAQLDALERHLPPPANLDEVKAEIDSDGAVVVHYDAGRVAFAADDRAGAWVAESADASGGAATLYRNGAPVDVTYVPRPPTGGTLN